MEIPIQQNIDDVRIRELKELSPPSAVIEEFPSSPKAADIIYATRRALHRILHRDDDRLIVVMGPCSIHDPNSAIEYASRLQAERVRYGDTLEIVMRVYFEKPRTTVGWKGLINDPFMDGSFKINEGLRTARRLLRDINELGLPAGSELLDTITPQYIADLISWGAIGARTTESQVHRQLASGLSCPVGFKNGTDGNIRIAVDAITAAAQPHHFPAVTKDGRSAIASTTGNDDCHLILRGGTKPNYDAQSVAGVCAELERAALAPLVMIDASHGNSEKQYENQVLVCENVAGQIAGGERRIVGVMVESHLIAGRQTHVPGKPLTYGQSITDACIGWDASAAVLANLSDAVRRRRNTR